MTLADSTLTPQFALEEVFGGPGTSPGAAQKRVFALGSMLAAALTAVVQNGDPATHGVVTAPAFPLNLGASPRTVIATIDGAAAPTATFTTGGNCVDTTAVTAAEWNAVMAPVVTGHGGTASPAGATIPSIQSNSTGPGSTVSIGGTNTTTWTGVPGVAATGGPPVTYTTPAGTAARNAVVQAFSPADATAKWGAGSELAMDAAVAFRADPACSFWGIAPPESGGSRATAVFTPAGTATAPGTIRVFVAGRFVDVPVSTGDTPSVIGANVAAAINNQGTWPVTAQNVWDTGVVTVTSKHVGPRANYVSFRARLQSATQTLDVGAGALSGVLFGVTTTLSGGTAAGGLYRLSGGTTDDDWTAAVAAVASVAFDRWAVPAYLVTGSPSANLARVSTQVVTAGGVGQQFAQQVVYGTNESYGNAVALAASLNDVRGQFPWLRFGDDTPGEIAAGDAAGRLAGDGALGGSLVGESSDPSANLNGLELPLRVQITLADQPLGTEIESALHHGVSPIAPSAARPGFTALVAAITSRSTDPLSGLPSLAVYKCKEVGVTDWVRASIVADLRTTYRGFKLVADVASGKPPKVPRVVRPSDVLARLYRLLKSYEALGYIVNVDATRSQLTAVINASNSRRLDMNIPCTPSQDFDIGGGQIRQQSPAAN